jgi:hypothetical protein
LEAGLSAHDGMVWHDERMVTFAGIALRLIEDALRWLVLLFRSAEGVRAEFSNWSVPKLAEYCRSNGLLQEVTDEWVRRLLRREGLSAQRIRTWKTSKDPHFDSKKNASASSTAAVRSAPR